jgi:hypothetical protein
MTRILWGIARFAAFLAGGVLFAVAVLTVMAAATVLGLL